MSTEAKLAEAIRNPGGGSIVNAPNAARRVREAFVVIDRDKVQRQVDTVMQYTAPSEYIREKTTVRRIKSGAAHVDIRAGADHARDMAVHYLALAQWIDEHPPVDEKAVKALTESLNRSGVSGVIVVESGQPEADQPINEVIARRLVADGWKRGGVS